MKSFIWLQAIGGDIAMYFHVSIAFDFKAPDTAGIIGYIAPHPSPILQPCPLALNTYFTYHT